MRKLWISAAILGVVLVAGYAALPYLIDANRFRGLVEKQLSARFRAPVSLGAMRLSTFPLAIQIADVAVAHPPGYTSPYPFLTAKELAAGVALWPLLRGEVQVQSARLVSPTVELIRNARGDWNLPPGDGGDGSSFSLDTLRVSDGQLAVTDLHAGTPREVYQHLDLDFRGLGAGRSGTFDLSARLDAYRATVHTEGTLAEQAGAYTAAGRLTWKAEQARETLEADYAFARDAAGFVRISKLDARLGKLALNASGTVDTSVQPARLQLAARTAQAPIGDLVQLSALLGNPLPSDLRVQGLLNADLQVTGTAAAPRFAGRIDATQAEFASKELAAPVRASALRVTLTPEALSTEPFTLETGGTRLTARATVSQYASEAPAVDAELETRDASLPELLSMASAYGLRPAGLSGTGQLSVRVKVSRRGEATTFSGSGALRQVSLTLPSIPKPLAISTATLAFAANRVVLDETQWAYGSSHGRGRFAVENFARPKINFDATVDQILAEEFTPPAGTGKSSAVPRSLTAQGTLAVGKLVYDRITLENVKTTVALADGVLNLNPLTARVFSGQHTGTITADLRQPTPVLTLHSALAAVDANQLLSATTSLRNVVNGLLGARLDLQVAPGGSGPAAESLNGSLSFQMGKGTLTGIKLMNELSGVARLLGYAGRSEPFTQIVKLAGSLKINRGVATTDDLALDFGTGSLTGAGTIGLADQKLNLRVNAVMGKEFTAGNGGASGQLGGLLASVLGNSKGEIVIPALVTGTFASPQFAPDAEGAAKMNLKKAAPGGLGDIVDRFRRKSGGKQ